MSEFKSFFKDKVKPIAEIKLKLARFDEEFKLQPISAAQQESIIDKSKKLIPGKKNRMEEKISEGKYVVLRVAESITYPDLDNSELQKSYGVMGREALVREMFTADELSEFISALENSEMTENLDDVVTEAKN